MNHREHRNMMSLEAAGVAASVETGKFVLGFCCHRAEYFVDLEIEKSKLEHDGERLKNIKKQVKIRVSNEMRPNMKPTDAVITWSKRVTCLKHQLKEAMKEADEELSKKIIRWCFPKHFCGYTRVGKRVKDVRKQVSELIDEGSRFSEVVARKPNVPAVILLEQNVLAPGLKDKLDQVLALIEDPKVRTLGLFGVPSVGKSILLNEINNSFHSLVPKFDVIILVQVSEDGDKLKVQEAICQRLNIFDWSGKNIRERASELWQIMKKKKFLLLLDGLGEQWSQSDLLEIGIPVNKLRFCGVIFTTRLKFVCNKMFADRSIKIEGLTEKYAIDLFKECVGEDTLNAHPSIPMYAKIAAKQCQGHIEILVTVARGMKGRKDPDEWLYLTKVLRKKLFELEGMDEVFNILRFNYDKLREDKQKIMFLYSSILSKNCTLSELYYILIGEGFLDSSSSTWDARKEGVFTVGSLRNAGLLEDEDIDMDDRIKRNAIRFNLASRLISKNEEFKILAHERNFMNWTKAERILICDSGVASLCGVPPCPQARTLLIRNSMLGEIPSGILKFMVSLQNLDLSGNQHLSKLPWKEVCELNNLAFFNLSKTEIRELPSKLFQQPKLKILLLDNTLADTKIPNRVMRASSLHVFSQFKDKPIAAYNDKALLDDLEANEHMNDISASLCSHEAVDKLLQSPKLQGRMRQLALFNIVPAKNPAKASRNISFFTFLAMDKLERLHVEGYQDLRIGADFCASYVMTGYWVFSKIVHLCIAYCSKVENLSWLSFAPCLQTLILKHCNSLADIIGMDFRDDQIAVNLAIFSNLKRLELSSLPILTHICHQVLPFAHLTQLDIHECPNLKTLPFDESSAERLEQIKASQRWWDSLCLEEKVRGAFHPKLKPG